jgi:hypothetical protein
MAQAQAWNPLPDGVAGDASPPQGYRPDLPRPSRNAQATSNYKCAVKLLEYIESKLPQDTNDLQEEPTSSTPEILENIALVKHQLDNLLGEINQLHQSAEDSSYANRSAMAISRLRERDLHQQNLRLTEEVKSITKFRDEMVEFAATNSKKLRESTSRIQKLEALRLDLCGERFDDTIEAKLKDYQSANKTLLDEKHALEERISQCEPSVRKFLLGK